MSSSASGQQFAIRLALEGAQVVQAGLQQLQATAVQSQQAIQQSGEAAGRAMVVVERGSQAASIALTKLGGDFSSLVPVVDNAGGAVARLVAGLGTGAGLAGALGLAAGAIGAAVALYQNWDAASRATATAVDFLTGRVRLNAEAITTANDRLRDYLRLSESAAVAGVRRQVETQAAAAAGFRSDVEGLDRNIADMERALARARGAVQVPQSGLGAVRLRPDERENLEQDMRQRAERRAETAAGRERIEQLERDLRVARAERERIEAARRQAEGNVAALGEAAGAVLEPWRDPNNDPNLPTPPGWQDPAARGGGAGGAVARAVNDSLRQREALIQRNATAGERLIEGLERIENLNAQLIAQGNDPLPEATAQREATRLWEEYEAAARRAGDAQQSAVDGSKELGRLTDGIGKTLAGGFEDIVFEGRRVNDVLKDMERQLLRLGNQHFLEPLFKGAVGAITGALGLGGGGGADGGAIGGALRGLFGGGGAMSGILGGAKGAVDALQAAGTFVTVMHEGGVVGAAGVPSRYVPASLFADAPRFHSGGVIGRGSIIGPDERPVIARVGETIRTEAQEAALRRSGGGITININGVKDPNAFRESQSQITAQLARALGRSGRNR